MYDASAFDSMIVAQIKRVVKDGVTFLKQLAKLFIYVKLVHAPRPPGEMVSRLTTIRINQEIAGSSPAVVIFLPLSGGQSNYIM